MTFVAYKTKDYAESQPQAQVSVWAGSFSVTAWQGSKFPALTAWQKFIATWERRSWSTVTRRERVLVTARSTDLITMTRSYWWDTAYQWETTDYFVLDVNSDVIQDMQDEIARLETDKLNISDFQAWNKTYWATSAWTDAYAITVTPAITAYTVWQVFRFIVDVANTWTATLNVCWLWAKTIKKLHDQDLATWDIEAWQIVTCSYDWTYFQMDSQLASIPVLDINWTTEDTVWDITTDFVIEYDASAWANRKILPSRRKATNAEANAWSATNKFVDPAQLARYAWKVVAWTIQANSWSVSWNTASTTYVKLWQWTIKKTWTYNVSFNVFNNSWSGVTAYWRIYKNGVAFWTETTDSGADWSPTWSSEDLSFADWDTIEMRAKTSNVSYNCSITSFAVKYWINLDIHFACS